MYTKTITKKENISVCIVYNVSVKKVFSTNKTNCIVLNGEQAIKMPGKGKTIVFQNHHNQLPVPFVIYADFKAITEKVQGCRPNDDKSFTEAYQNHKDCSYGYKVVCCYDEKYTKPVQAYRGENAVYNFMERMLNEGNYCKKIIKNNFNKPLKMTDEDEEDR